MSTVYEWDSDSLVLKTSRPDGSELSSRVGFVQWDDSRREYRALAPLGVGEWFVSKKDAKAWVLAMVRLTN